MKTNFEIENNYAVLYKNRLIDLHNNFDFIGLTDDPDKKEITLNFTRTDGKWVKDSEFSRLTFFLKNVAFKHFEEGNFTEDAKCLGEMTFFPSVMREDNHSITLQRTPKEDDDLIFTFEDGKVVRVNCEEAELKVEE